MFSTRQCSNRGTDTGVLEGPPLKDDERRQQHRKLILPEMSTIDKFRF